MAPKCLIHTSVMKNKELRSNKGGGASFEVRGGGGNQQKSDTYKGKPLSENIQFFEIGIHAYIVITSSGVTRYCLCFIFSS